MTTVLSAGPVIIEICGQGPVTAPPVWRPSPPFVSIQRPWSRKQLSNFEWFAVYECLTETWLEFVFIDKVVFIYVFLK